MMTDLREEQKENVFDSMRVKLEPVSNELDSQAEKHFEQRI
jgi:hypothetical protein